MVEILTVSDIQVEVERKSIKNMHLAVYPPDARVHLSMPEYLTDADARSFILQKWEWICKQRKEVLEQARQTQREYVSGESHYLFGTRYQLIVEELPHEIGQIMTKGNKLFMLVKAGTTPEKRGNMLRAWYRARLREQLTDQIARWAENLGEKGFTWEIRQMKTEWGSCLPRKRQLIFSLELARVPIECIDFVIVHEFSHFLVDNHNKLFESVMDKRLPSWRNLRKQLNDFIALPYNGIDN